jgi:signal transduction histidine kinase
MSHELRTPLNAIIGVTEMLHEDAVDEKRADELEPLERVLRAAEASAGADQRHSRSVQDRSRQDGHPHRVLRDCAADR